MYVAKFASKAEHKSKSYKQLVADVAPHISSSGNPLLSLVVRVMNKLLAERDWSRQEVMHHHLLGLHLVDASRTVVPVDCRPEAKQGQRFQAPPGDGADVVEARSLVHKYKMRPCHQDLDALSFFRWATLHNHRDHSVRPRAKPAVLSYFPKYTRGTEDFARIKMMLHHQFRDDVADVLHWDGHPTLPTWTPTKHARRPAGTTTTTTTASRWRRPGTKTRRARARTNSKTARRATPGRGSRRTSRRASRPTVTTTSPSTPTSTAWAGVRGTSTLTGATTSAPAPNWTRSSTMSPTSAPSNTTTGPTTPT